jgi:hypothetical protein
LAKVKFKNQIINPSCVKNVQYKYNPLKYKSLKIPWKHEIKK